MDKLKEMLEMDPCYEQHIVSIKEFYEEYMFSILVPAIYEGFQSMYKRSYMVEQKYLEAAKRNPDIKPRSVLEVFQVVIKEIPNLNTYKIRNETDRIKSSTRSADVFDDLVKAVAKANIILLTYNVDHKRKNLLQTNYHENVIVHDFIHSCYIHSGRNFFGCAELFYHKFENIVINQNKRICFKIIRDSVKEAIRFMLPMKEILLEYITQKYEQKEKFMNPYHGIGGMGIPGVGQEEFINVNEMVNQDISKYSADGTHSLLENENNSNSFGSGSENKKEGEDDFSLLLDGGSERDHDGDSLLEDERDSGDTHEDGDKDRDVTDGTSGTDGTDKTEDKERVKDEHKGGDRKSDHGLAPATSASASDHGLKMIDISGSVERRGSAQTYFRDVMPDIQKRLGKYKQDKKDKKKDDKEDTRDIEIKRVNSTENYISESRTEKDGKGSRSEEDKHRSDKHKDVKDYVSDILK